MNARVIFHVYPPTKPTHVGLIARELRRRHGLLGVRIWPLVGLLVASRGGIVGDELEDESDGIRGASMELISVDEHAGSP